MKKFWSNTIFARQTYLHPNEKLAVYYHRTAATLYGIYALWGVLAIIGRIPTIEAAIGALPQVWFSLFTVVVTVPACIGASHFPKLGRLELFSSSSLAALLAIYEVFILIKIFEGGGFQSAASFVLVLSCLVVPLSRVVFIYVTLVRKASASGKI